MSARRILHCHCVYARVVPEDVKQNVLRGLSESGCEFDTVADLCELSAKGDPALKALAEQPDLKIAACYPRAVKWLFSAAEAPLRSDVQILNMRTQPAEEIVDHLLTETAVEEPHS